MFSASKFIHHYDQSIYPYVEPLSSDYRVLSTAKRSRYTPAVEFAAPINLDGIQTACVHDVTCRNIRVYYDEKIPKTDGKFNVPILVRSFVDDVDFYHIDISGISINGTIIDAEHAVLDIENVKDFKF